MHCTATPLFVALAPGNSPVFKRTIKCTMLCCVPVRPRGSTSVPSSSSIKSWRWPGVYHSHSGCGVFRCSSSGVPFTKFFESGRSVEQVNNQYRAAKTWQLTRQCWHSGWQHSQRHCLQQCRSCLWHSSWSPRAVALWGDESWLFDGRAWRGWRMATGV